MHFPVTSSFWLRPSSFLCHSFVLGRSHLLPDQLPGEHTGMPPHMGQCLPLSAFRATHLHISHTHTLTAGRWKYGGWTYLDGPHMFLMCTNFIDMTAHTAAFFAELGTTYIYIYIYVCVCVCVWNAAQLVIVMHHTFGAMSVGQSPIHVLTGLMIA